MAKVAPGPDPPVGVSPALEANASTASPYVLHPDLCAGDSTPCVNPRGRRSVKIVGGVESAVSSNPVHRLRYVVRDVFYKTGWYDSTIAVSLRKIVNGRVFGAVALLALFLALFMTDICIIARVSENTLPDTVLTLVLAIFVVEFIGFSVVDASYIFSFYFWMDLLGIISLPFDLSYMLGPDVTKEKHVHRDNRASEQMMLARLGRILRLGARAGRLSRALKVARYMQKNKEGGQNVAVAKVISTQLANTLSTRVAFLTICIVVAMPIFGAFSYPEWDDSMGAWTQMLADTTDAYYSAVVSSNQTAVSEQETILVEELDKFVEFYSTYLYGPFEACYGDQVGGDFVCHPNDFVSTAFSQNHFSMPSRRAAVRQVSQGSFMAAFDMSRTEEDESAANIALICFVISAMVGFGMVLNSNITVIALQPLERMLSVVRQRCKQIFAYTREIKEEEGSDFSDDDEEEYDEQEQRSEFILLERVVSKLAAIVQLRVKRDPDVKEHMDENDLMVIHWTQSHQVPQSRNKADADAQGKEEDNRDARRDESTPTPGQGSMVVSSINLDLPSEVLTALESPAGGFSTLDLSKDLRIQVAAHIILSAEGSSTWLRGNVQEHHLHNFVTSVAEKYPDNPFHSFAHGLDVLYSLCRYVRLIEAGRFLPETTQFWMMIAAAAHDIGHLGVNNQYLIEIGHELAIRYNDRSPLENMHCAKLFHVVSEPEANVFAQLDKDLYKDMRKGIIGAILHTDMIKHNEMVKELALLYQMHSEAFDGLDPVGPVTQSQASTTCVINSLVHCADVSNPTKPWALCQKLAHLCLEEFFAQGDLEKAAGIPVQMLNDRDKVNRPTSQIGFIEFVICPLVEGEVRLFPQLDSLAQNLAENVRRWSELWQREVSPAEDALAKVEARVHKMEARCAALERGR